MQRNDRARLLDGDSAELGAIPAYTTPAPRRSRSELTAAAEIPVSAVLAVAHIQSRFRGAVVRRRVHRNLGRAVGVPELAAAKRYARSLMPQDQEGDLLPLSCPIECFRVFGTGIYVYMLWVRLMRRVFLVAFLFSLANLVNNMTGAKLENSSWLSIHTLGNVSSLNASYGASELMVLFALLYGMFQAVAIVRHEAALLKPHSSPADHTILLTGLSTAPLDREELIEAMAELGGKITHAAVSLPIRDVVMRMAERAELLRQLETARIQLFLKGQKPRPTEAAHGAQAQKREALLAKVEAAAEKLIAHDIESTRMLQAARRRRTTGKAFITFEDPADAARAIDEINALTAKYGTPRGGGGDGPVWGAATPLASLLRLRMEASAAYQHGIPAASAASDAALPPASCDGGGPPAGGPSGRSSAAASGSAAPPDPERSVGRVVARRAPEPSDVIWENLQVGRHEQRRRQLISTLIMLVTACFGTAVITFISYTNNTHLYDRIVTLPPGFRGFITGLLIQLGLVFPVIFGNVIIFISVPILADKYERHHTHASKENAVMLKLIFFQVFNTCVSASAFYLFNATVQQYPRQWYSLGGALIANIMFGDSIFIQLLLDWAKVDVFFLRVIKARFATTQLQMDQIYAQPAGIYLAFRLHLAGKFIILCPMFGSAIPILYLFAAMYFWLAAWIDRYNLLRRLAPPPVTDATLTNVVALFVFPIGIVLHVILALVFFAQIPTVDEAARIMQPPPPTPPPPYLPNVSAPAYPPSPAPAPPAGDGLGLGWLAYHMQVVTTVIAACVVGFFGLREYARRRGWTIRFISDAQRRAVLKVITQEPDDEHANLAAATAPLAGHRSDTYLPPVAAPLLGACGYGGDARRAAGGLLKDVAKAGEDAERTIREDALRSHAPPPMSGTRTGSVVLGRGESGLLDAAFSQPPSGMMSRTPSLNQRAGLRPAPLSAEQRTLQASFSSGLASAPFNDLPSQPDSAKAARPSADEGQGGQGEPDEPGPGPGE